MSEHTAECTRLRDRLLVADPAELRGEGASDIARHVRTCAACGRIAQLLVAEQARLNEAISILVAPLRVRRRSRAVAWSAGSLAAAAAVALLLLPVRPERELAELPGPIAVVSDMPVVNAAGDRAVAVMRTSDPRITVVWYLEQER